MTSQYKRPYTAVEAAEILINDSSDDEENFPDIVLLLPGKVDLITDDEEVDDNVQKIGLALPADVNRAIEIHSNTALTDIYSIKYTGS